MNLRLIDWALAAALVFVAPVQAKQQPDYRKNHYYNLGNRDGYHDYKKKQHEEHKHQFDNSDDREAYDEGYKVGWLGRRAYRIDHPLSSWSRVRTLRSETY